MTPLVPEGCLHPDAHLDAVRAKRGVGVRVLYFLLRVTPFLKNSGLVSAYFLRS